MLFYSALVAITALVGITSAAPACHAPAGVTHRTTPFYLVATDTTAKEEAVTDLKNGSALILFDPYHQPNYLLRAATTSAASITNYTITNGVLHSIASRYPFGQGYQTLNSTPVTPGSQFSLVAQNFSSGDLSLRKNYLLAVNGTAEGWNWCQGPLGLEVLHYRGTGDCTPTYVQALAVNAASKL